MGASREEGQLVRRCALERSSAEEVVPHGANDLQITPSMGLWMTAPDKSEDDPTAVYSITVNYPGTL